MQARHIGSLDRKGVILRPLKDIPQLILTGEITHALRLAAFYRFYVEYNGVFPK